MCKKVKTRVGRGVGVTYGFGAGVGPHQGFVLGPFLFNIVSDMLTDGVREGLPWDMLYADDVVLEDESKEEIQHSLSKWGMALESIRMKMSRPKT